MSAIRKEYDRCDQARAITPPPADYGDELTEEFYKAIDAELKKDDHKPEEFEVVDGPAW